MWRHWWEVRSRLVQVGLQNCEGWSSDVLFIKINTERNRGRVEEKKQKKTEAEGKIEGENIELIGAEEEDTDDKVEDE